MLPATGISEKQLTGAGEVRSCQIASHQLGSLDPTCLYLGRFSDLPSQELLPQSEAHLPCFLLASHGAQPIPPGLNVCLVEHDTDLASLKQDVDAILDDDMRFAELSTKAIEAVSLDKSLEESVALISGVLGNTVMVNDASFNSIASAYQSGSTKATLSADVSIGFLQDSVVDLMRSGGIIAAIRQEGKTVRTRHPVTGTEWLFKSALINGLPAADIALVADNRPFRHLDYRAIELLATIVSIMLQKERFFETNVDAATAFFMRALLSGSLTDRQAINQRAHTFHIGLHAYFLVCAAKPVASDPQSLSAPYLERQLRKALPEGTWARADGVVVGLFSSDKKARLDLAHDKRLLKFAADNSVEIGLSDLYRDVVSTPFFHLQAIHACNTSPGEKETPNVKSFSEVFTAYVVDVLRKNDADTTLMHPKLTALQEYDQEHGASLIETLEAYLRMGKNAAHTAHLLNVHRNSLLYRLNRIRDIADIDFDDGEEMLRLLLNLQMIRRTR